MPKHYLDYEALQYFKSKLDLDLAKILSDIAPDFNSSLDYPINAKVIYQKQLYKHLVVDSEKIYLKITTRWCKNQNTGELDPNIDWEGTDHHIYACFYSEVVGNGDIKNTEKMVGKKAWPGEQMITINNPDGTFNYAVCNVPEGAVAVIFNSGLTGDNSRCMVTIKNVSELTENNKCFTVNTVNTFYGQRQDGSWGENPEVQGGFYPTDWEAIDISTLIDETLPDIITNSDIDDLFD